MELWVRSQDKEVLGKAKEIMIYEKEKRCEILIDCYTYGTYATKERALEVLDEIQENIVKQGQVIILTDERGIANGSKFFSYVYEMPKE